MNGPRWSCGPRRATLALLFLGAAAGMAALAACGDPAGTEDDAEDRILFLSDRAAPSHLDSIAPRYYRDVFSVPSGGGTPENLTGNAAPFGYPRLSPDQEHLALTADWDWCGILWLMDVNTGLLRQLTNLDQTERCSWDPRWSPDGARIAFSTNTPDSGLRKYESGLSWEVHVVNRDGTAELNITGNPSLEWESNYDRVHGWTPEGRVVLHSNRDGVMRIWTMDPDGSDPRPLFEAGYARPYWSPDGSKVAVWAGAEVLVLRADGTGAVNVSDHDAWDDLSWSAADPWSPDGTLLAFHSTRGPSGVYVVSGDGNQLRYVHEGRFNGWSPDGTQLLLTWSGDVYAVDPDGSNLFNLSDDPADDADPVWVRSR
jgi:Tol biopolymer transport system component